MKGKYLLALLACSSICLSFSHLYLDYALLPKLGLLAWSISTITTYNYIRSRKIDTQISFDKNLIPLFLFIAFIAISAFWATNKQLALLDITKKVLAFILTILVYQTIKNKPRQTIQLIITVVIVVSLFSNFIALFQVFSIPNFNPSKLSLITGAHANKNLASSFNYLCLIFSIIGLSIFKGIKRKTAIISIILQLGLIVALQSRGVWIALCIFIVSIISLLVLKQKRHERISAKKSWITQIAVTLVFNIFFIIILPPQVKNLSDHDSFKNTSANTIFNKGSLRERILIWDKTYDLFFQHPWIGVGSNNWQINYPKNGLANIYRTRKEGVNFQRPHNDFLWILSEYGIIGFNAFIITLSITLTASYKRISKNKSLIDMVTFSGLLGFLAIASFSYPLERIEHNLLLALLIAITLRPKSQYEGGLKTAKRNMYLFSAVISTCCLLFVISYTRSDYYMKKIVTGFDLTPEEVIANCEKINTRYYTCNALSIPTNWYKGNAQVLQKDYNSALKSFKKAEKSSPYNSHILMDLGSAYYCVGENTNAILSYKESIRINPSNKNSLHNLIKVLIEEKQYEDLKHYISLVEDEEVLKEHLHRLTLKKEQLENH